MYCGGSLGRDLHKGRKPDVGTWKCYLLSIVSQIFRQRHFSPRMRDRLLSTLEAEGSNKDDIQDCCSGSDTATWQTTEAVEEPARMLGLSENSGSRQRHWKQNL